MRALILILGLSFASLLLGNCPIEALADPSSPTSEIKKAFDNVKVIVTKEKASLTEEALDNKLKVVIEPMFDFGEMSKRSLGAYWAKATPAEQKEFVSLFSDLLARTYLKRIKRNAENSNIEKITDEVQDNKASVRTVVKSDGEEISIDYRLLLQQQGWKIYDVVVENVGLVSNYRNEFPAIIKKDGFPGLIARLKDKQAENREAVSGK